MEKKAIDLSFLDPRGAWGALKNFTRKGREVLPAPIRSAWDTAQGWNPLYRELTGAPAYIDHTKDPVFKYDPRKNWDDLQEAANSKGWVPGVANAVATSLPRAINIAIDRALTDRHKTDPNVSLASDVFDLAMAYPGMGAAKTGVQATAGISRAAARGATAGIRRAAGRDATAGISRAAGRDATKAMAKPGVNGLGRNALAAAGGAVSGVTGAARNWFTGLGPTPWTRTLTAADNVLGNAAMAQYFLNHHGAPGLPAWKLPNFAQPWIGGPDSYDGWTGLQMYNPFGLLRSSLTGNFKPFLRNWGISQAGEAVGVAAAGSTGHNFLLQSDGLYTTDPNAYATLTMSDNTPDGSLAPGIGGQVALTLANKAVNNNTLGLNDMARRYLDAYTREGDTVLELADNGVPIQNILFEDPESEQLELTPAAKAMLQDPYWRAELLKRINAKHNPDGDNEYAIN